MEITYAKNDLTIHYSGSYTYSYDINPAHITGDVEIDVQNEEIKKLQAGAFITINQQGYAELADGATAVHAKAIRVSATRSFFTNSPAIASSKVTAIGAPAVIETIQVKEDDIKPGDALYVGTGADKGILTKTKGTSTLLAGYALSANSSADKTLKVELV